MPADRLTFAIFVRCEVQHVCVFEQILKFLDLILLVLRNNIDRLKIRIDVYAQPRPGFFFQLYRNLRSVFRQVTYVPHRRTNHIILP